jgi:hypothetical protein
VKASILPRIARRTAEVTLSVTNAGRATSTVPASQSTCMSPLALIRLGEPLLTIYGRWEHTPEWTLTSKLLISKHQQVQLLEAASILVNLNQDGPTPPNSAKDFHSDESASPAASSSSEQHDGTSSADTTPPPQADMFGGNGSYRHKRMSSGYSGYSRSYQSAPSATSYTESVSNGSAFGHYRQQSQERQLLSSGISEDNENDDLATAINLLSCSFQSQRSNSTPRMVIPVTMDTPPVPNIPAQYLSNFSGSTLGTNHHPRQTESYTRHQIHSDRDVKMEESEESIADDEEYDQRSRGRSDEDDDGVFGRMEE